MITLPAAPLGPGHFTVAAAPTGVDAQVLAAMARAYGDIVHVTTDETRLARLAELLEFFAPDITVLQLPSWDCMPYDRVSPNQEVASQRLHTLSLLASAVATGPRIVLTAVSSVLQRVPPKEVLAQARLEVRIGERLDRDRLLTFLNRYGYNRADTVMEAGEYSLRGGLVDLFPTGADNPLRLDLFGDDLESIRIFDPVSQRTIGNADKFVLAPVSETPLDAESVARFRSGYRQTFGVPANNDHLYESVSSGQRVIGMEHWLPLFYDGLDTLFAYVPDAVLSLDFQVPEVVATRHSTILDHYDARQSLLGKGEAGMVYNPLPPPRLYLEPDEWARLVASRPCFSFSPYPPYQDTDLDAGGRGGQDFAEERSRLEGSVYSAVVTRVKSLTATPVLIAAWSTGSRDRLGHVLRDHGLETLLEVENWPEAQNLGAGQVGLTVLGLEHGFATEAVTVITEQDILGDRLARPVKKKRKGAAFIAEASALSEGDLVVHAEHGIGRYDGLVTLDVAGVAHDCLRILYDGGDKLFVPVENLDVLTRYGAEDAGVPLDRLGSKAWQGRKARLKKRIQDMAEQLIAVAAQRSLRTSETLAPPEGLWDEFCARFPYVETEDQTRTIEEVIGDLASGRPMDRLVCGDVGFGKTEVALRAAFIAAMAGMQVAVVVPTTLLARQHLQTFTDRFKGLPLRIAGLSRLSTSKQANETKKGLADGTVDIVVGTHALLAKSLSFKRLGLLIVDEEQHFGVAHKERLKQLKADVHILTLSATPIPRTLQLALTGVKEMSVIATPPIDRLAVRTFILPFDPVVIREAIQRELNRGGQVFYVCPRLADIDRVMERLRKLMPELRVAIAHGQLTPTALEEVMTAFADHHYDVLLSTQIIESGLDMPSVNTIIIHRADMFGLGQLYQLRGRVGRGKARGYAYLTLPPDRVLSTTAEKRLHVMQSLDSLGAGFTLASHDLDIRGAGNLLGEEQSGHIREVGIELYQQLVEEAVEQARSGTIADTSAVAEPFSPQISVGTPVLIPETYVKDLSVRLGLYRRIADMSDRATLDALAAELVDRFGPLPQEIKNLLEIIEIKSLCRQAGIEKLDAGPKGAVVTFHNNAFPNPTGLVEFLSRQLGMAKLRPDHKLVLIRAWEDEKRRVSSVRAIVAQLATIATASD